MIVLVVSNSLKTSGLAVTINADYSLSTIWDNINLGNEFDVVAEALRNYVLSKKGSNDLPSR